MLKIHLTGQCIIGTLAIVSNDSSLKNTVQATISGVSFFSAAVAILKSYSENFSAAVVHSSFGNY